MCDISTSEVISDSIMYFFSDICDYNFIKGLLQPVLGMVLLCHRCRSYVFTNKYVRVIIVWEGLKYICCIECG